MKQNPPNQWWISLPLSVQVSKNKKFILNLNQYRNTHYMTLNKAKREFEKVIAPLVQDLPIFTKVELDYYLYIKTKKECDLNNVISIVDKFFCDTLVTLGKLPDDNYKVIANVCSHFKGIDFDNPRVEVCITSSN